ncbi:MAG TPA: preprotein translocase subunit YajC [Candidatus Acidoferrales bacterium]|nr:preprotein translocase subunit YajC [Candidatus Acidoferrales bacterium]
MATFSIPAETLALAQTGQQSGGSAFTALAPLFIIVIIFYLLLFVPQQRRQKKVQQMQGALKAGDKIIMTCGIYGTVVGVENDTVQLRIAEQMKIKVSKQSVAALQEEPKES